jgi:hypothetical protein
MERLLAAIPTSSETGTALHAGGGGVPTKILITQNRIYFKTIESIVFIQKNLNFVFNK